jgi:hypothetical protein
MSGGFCYAMTLCWIVEPTDILEVMHILYPGGNDKFNSKGMKEEKVKNLFYLLTNYQVTSQLNYEMKTGIQAVKTKWLNILERKKFDEACSSDFDGDKHERDKKNIYNWKEYTPEQIQGKHNLNNLLVSANSLLLHVYYTDDKGNEGAHTVAVKRADGAENRKENLQFFDANDGITFIEIDKLDEFILQHFIDFHVKIFKIQVMVINNNLFYTEVDEEEEARRQAELDIGDDNHNFKNIVY